MFSYFIGFEFHKIMKFDCHPYFLRKIKMQDTRNEHDARFSVSNNIVPFYFKNMYMSVFPFMQ